jgi:hypothetical protein
MMFRSRSSELLLHSLHFSRAFPEVRFGKVGLSQMSSVPRFESPKMIKTRFVEPAPYVGPTDAFYSLTLP